MATRLFRNIKDAFISGTITKKKTVIKQPIVWRTNFMYFPQSINNIQFCLLSLS